VVEDDGPGIPEHDIPQALQRGFRLDESTAGHGLGLGIVRNLAQLYRGSLTIGKSSLGGVSAILQLPGM
jgi:signal transduction histidine kinase